MPSRPSSGAEERLVSLRTANCGWQVSSLSETKAHQVMQQKASPFIHFNQQQLSRIYPSSYRVDSSNFNPQPFWNAGCQLGRSQSQRASDVHYDWVTLMLTDTQTALVSVALNYQSEGRVLQLNRAKFYSNGNCGYILKPACMSEGEQREATETHSSHSVGNTKFSFQSCFFM